MQRDGYLRRALRARLTLAAETLGHLPSFGLGCLTGRLRERHARADTLREDMSPPGDRAPMVGRSTGYMALDQLAAGDRGARV